MRVKDCVSCRHCTRRTWVQSYKPANYHTIGFSHAYHRCEFHKKRCSEVKRCESFEDKSAAKAQKEY